MIDLSWVFTDTPRSWVPEALSMEKWFRCVLRNDSKDRKDHMAAARGTYPTTIAECGSGLAKGESPYSSRWHRAT